VEHNTTPSIPSELVRIFPSQWIRRTAKEYGASQAQRRQDHVRGEGRAQTHVRVARPRLRQLAWRHDHGAGTSPAPEATGGTDSGLQEETRAGRETVRETEAIPFENFQQESDLTLVELAFSDYN
jgi:hypothetical protein